MARPKRERSFAEMLRVAINEARQDGGEGTKLRQLAEVLVDNALEGKQDAIKEIADRLDGKPIQQNENFNEHDLSDPLAELLKNIASNGKRAGKG